jgi:hypothetical protein
MVSVPDVKMAHVDLGVQSTFQHLLDAASYPEGHRRVRWHPIAGIGGFSVPSPTQNPLALAAWELAKRHNFIGALSVSVDPMQGDLIVHRLSATNGQPMHATEMQGIIHSEGPASFMSFFGVESLIASQEVANEVRDLLHESLSQNDWMGDLGQ